MLNENDIHYEYDSRGYMMYYKGKPIGGAGIDKSAKGCRSNVKLFRKIAHDTEQALLHGRGDQYMKDRIKEIDEEKRHAEVQD